MSTMQSLLLLRQSGQGIKYLIEVLLRLLLYSLENNGVSIFIIDMLRKEASKRA